jgi:hypothetical protein
LRAQFLRLDALPLGLVAQRRGLGQLPRGLRES